MSPSTEEGPPMRDNEEAPAVQTGWVGGDGFLPDWEDWLRAVGSAGKKSLC